MRKIIIMISLIFIYQSISCSQNELNGIVIDGITKKPVDSFSVTLLETKKSGVTNSKGEFNIQLAQTNETVKYQNEGFEIFWQNFSKAVINKQKAKVISYTHFPFYSDYGFLDQQSFSNNYDWLFDMKMIKGIKNAKVDKMINVGEDESIELIKLNKKDAKKILDYLNLPLGRVIYYFKYQWVEESSDKYLELWNDLIFIQFENTFKLVSDQNPWISF